MNEASTAHWEIAVVLPLGVVANQLRRIETQLRLINMTAVDLAREGSRDGLARLIDPRLDGIVDVLDSMRRLVADIAADLEPKAALPYALQPGAAADRLPFAPDATLAPGKPRPARED